VRDFRTVDAQNPMCKTEAANKTKTSDSAYGTYKHIKRDAVCDLHVRQAWVSIYDGVNPMTGVTIPG